MWINISLPQDAEETSLPRAQPNSQAAKPLQVHFHVVAVVMESDSRWKLLFMAFWNSSSPRWDSVWHESKHTDQRAWRMYPCIPRGWLGSRSVLWRGFPDWASKQLEVNKGSLYTALAICWALEGNKQRILQFPFPFSFTLASITLQVGLWQPPRPNT